MLFWQRSTRKCFPHLWSSQIGGQEGKALSSPCVMLLIKELVPFHQICTTILLHFFSLLDSCHLTQTPCIHLVSEVTFLKNCVIEPWALGKMTNAPQVRCQAPSLQQANTAFDLWWCAAPLLCIWRCRGRSEKAKGGARSFTGIHLSVIWFILPVDLLFFRSPGGWLSLHLTFIHWQSLPLIKGGTAHLFLFLFFSFSFFPA